MKSCFKHHAAIALCSLMPVLTGCANTSPGWESTFGDASRQMRAAQVINPNAATQNTGVGNTDGKVVEGAQKAYAESYGYGVKEAKQPALSISTTGAR